MLCQKCGENEASVHLTRIINGKKEELHLCESCAKKSGEFSFHADNNFAFQSLLSGVLNNNLSPKNKSIFKNNIKEESICENCELNYSDFSKNGLFGCSDCYDKFEDKLDPLFKRIHGTIRHTGKKPSRYNIKKENEQEIDLLKEQMEKAVEEENFEKAAEIRDRIHEIKKSMEEDIDESYNN
jgi:protein arginine kinase activator